MQRIPDDFLLPENRAFLELRDRLNREIVINPDILPPFLRPCRVRTLIVTDGGLDFSAADFGLSTFVTTLLDTVSPARFEITLGHMEDRSGNAMMAFEPRIKERIANFEFDEPSHFMPDKFDVVFLFGIRTTLARRDSNFNIRTDASGNPYPTDRLANTELQLLGEFMNGGGGLFATGDHGALGRFLGQALPRARNMRLWQSTSGNNDLDEVSMTGQRRNDTNRLGDPGSQFDDQSDDIPQPVQPKMYSVSNGLFRYSYPHPLLCGPRGVIRVMPDHPHEGECVEPADTAQNLNFTGPLGPEYPPATDGGARPLPQVISTNSVLAGTRSGTKDPTVAHSFGGICAYDGHRASVGRVVTDATWHHFVNINLVGDVGNLDPIKSQGFLASPAGQQHFENIKAYYRNLGIWLSRKSNISCMNNRWIIGLLQTERVLEAVLTTRDVRFEQVSPATFWHIGRHARDVLGKFASRCQSVRLILDLIFPEFDPRIPEIDPWWQPFTRDELRERRIRLPKRAEGDVTWVNAESLLDLSLGAALVAVSEEIDFDRGDVDEKAVEKAATHGAKRGLEIGVRAIDGAFKSFRASFS